MDKKVEKTKQNIGISQLDHQTKKGLFDKFIDAGGEVIKEKKQGHFVDFDREKQKRYKYKLEKHAGLVKDGKAKKTTRDRTKRSIPKKIKSAPSRRRKADRVRLFFERFYIKSRLFMMRVTDYNAYYITPKFLDRFDVEYKTALIYMHMVYLDIFKQNFRSGKRIIDRLDNAKPIYYELIEMISDVFDRTAINRILEHFYNFPDIPRRCEEIQEPLMVIFKKLYPLVPYQEFLSQAFQKAIELQMKIEKKNSHVYTVQKKKIRNNLYLIFNKLFPRLYWLFCLYERRIISEGMEIDEIIAISFKEKPGKRKKAPVIMEIELPFLEKPPEKVVEEEQEAIPDEVKKGIELMYRLDINVLRNKYIQNELFIHVNETDKTLTTNLLFKEFEEEYSFILTTNKIKYNKISTSREKLDYKTKLSDLYNDLRKCISSLNEYAKILASYEKARQEKPRNNEQYIKYSNRLKALEKGKNNSSRNARMGVKAFLEKLCNELRALIHDMETSSRIVANPQDIVVFDPDIEGEKKLNEKKVFEVIITTYNYAMALIYRLSHKGDLSGSVEFEEGEQTIFDSHRLTENSGSNDKNKKRDKEKSIVDELEDFI